MADAASGWADDRPERYQLSCGRGASKQPQTVSTRRVAGPDAGGDGALDAHARVSFEEGDVSGLGLFSGAPGVHHGRLQCAGPVARSPALRVWLRAPLDRGV